jgi:hypothetical protein
VGDGYNHVVKIVCGAGKHSKEGVGVLIQWVPDYLEYIWGQPRDDMYLIRDDGILLLRLHVNQNLEEI